MRQSISSLGAVSVGRRYGRCSFRTVNFVAVGGSAVRAFLGAPSAIYESMSYWILERRQRDKIEMRCEGGVDL